MGAFGLWGRLPWRLILIGAWPDNDGMCVATRQLDGLALIYTLLSYAVKKYLVYNCVLTSFQLRSS